MEKGKSFGEDGTMHELIREIEAEQLKSRPDFSVGDTIKVHQKIVEGNKERIQVFTGTVIARKGKGVSETFSVHRVAYGEGMERVFMLHSPRIDKIELMRRGRVRRAKLYYLRGKSGKKARVRQQLGAAKQSKETIPEAVVGTEETTE